MKRTMSEQNQSTIVVKRPNEPKAAYFLFEAVQKPIIMAQLFPDGKVNTSQLQDALRKKWAAVRENPEESAKLQEMVDADIKRYQTEMEAYVASQAKNDAVVAEVVPDNVAEPQVKKSGKQKISLESLGLTQDSVTCHICQDTLFEPITLPCSHKICKECASNQLSRGYEENDGSAGRNRRDSGVMRCGVCRRDHQIDLRNCPIDRMLESILKTVMGDDYSGRLLVAQEKTNKARLVESYLPSGGYGEMGETAQIIHVMALQLLEGYLAESQVNKRLVLNPGEIIQILQTNDFITSTAGFSIGNLAYFHFYFFMMNGIGSRYRLYRIGNKTILADSSALIDYITSDNPQGQLVEPHQKELMYLTCMYCSLVDNGPRRMGDNPDNVPDCAIQIQSKLGRVLPPEYETFNYNIHRSSQQNRDSGRSIIEAYFNEIYPQIIADPKMYPAFAETIGLAV